VSEGKKKMGTYAAISGSSSSELDHSSDSFGDLALVGICWSVVLAVLAPVLVFGKSEGQSDKCRKGYRSTCGVAFLTRHLRDCQLNCEGVHISVQQSTLRQVKCSYL